MSHKVLVSVTNGQPTVDNSKLKPGTSPATLEWQLTSEAGGYAFPSQNSIVIQGNNGQFSAPVVSSNGKKVSIDDANTDGQTYTYTITLQQTGAPGKTLRLDPTIENMTRPK